MITAIGDDPLTVGDSSGSEVRQSPSGDQQPAAAFPRHYGKIVCGPYHAHRDQFPVDLRVLTFPPYATQHHMRKL